jgi:propanol-preferring alcohol dehydrogenase
MSKTAMKAAILTSPREISKRPLEIREVPRPELKDGHVLLRVLACGVCRTDLHIVEGELPQRFPEIIPGHQIVGEIVDEGTTNLLRGARVGVSWIGGVDGSCWYCRQGFENLCDSPTFTGYTFMAATRSTRSHGPTLPFPCRGILTICRPRPCYAPALSAFEACASRK